VTKIVSIKMLQILFFKDSEGRADNESLALAYFFSSSASSLSLASYSSSSINYMNIKAKILIYNDKSRNKTKGNQS
jgi:hypothetical protein